MKSIFAMVVLVLLQGCLASAPKRPVQWLVEPVDSSNGSRVTTSATARLSRLTVLPPYDGTAIAVLRADGSIAFDGCNAFAAAPSALLANAVIAALRREYPTVLFGGATGADVSCEVMVRKFALDCRVPGRRVARVELTVNRLSGRPQTVRVQDGTGESDAADGNYSRAFSQALAAAMEDALR